MILTAPSGMPSTTTWASMTALPLPPTTWEMLFHFGAARRARILAVLAAPLLAVLPDRSVSVSDSPGRSLGRCLTTTGFAERHLDRRRLRTFARNLWARNNRGLAYLKVGKREKARWDFQEALRIEPAFEQAKRNLQGIPPP